jgi:MFS family permease
MAQPARESESSPPIAGAVPPGYARYALGALFVVYIFNFLDRQLLNLFVEPIKAELGVSDTQMGLLTGLSFALFYVLAGLPLARWADRHSRTALITAGMIVWSGMTAATGLARTYVHLLLARVGVGVGEASFTPAAHSLITDYFPPERRGGALAIFSAGASAGTIIGYLGGGALADALGWRAAFVILGLAGIPFALIFRLTVKEPLRGLSAAQAAAASRDSTRVVLRYLFSRKSFVFLVASASMHGFSSYGSGSWSAAFLMRVHELSLTEAGVILGLGSGVGATIGQIISGRVVDRLGARDMRWFMWQPALTSIVSLPFVLAFLWSWDFYSALWLYMLAAAISSAWTGPTYAMGQALVRPHMRAMASAVLVFMLNLVGLGLGPLIVGMLNDWLDPSFGQEAVRYSLMFAAVPHALAAIFNLLAVRTLREDLETAQAEEE